MSFSFIHHIFKINLADLFLCLNWVYPKGKNKLKKKVKQKEKRKKIKEKEKRKKKKGTKKRSSKKRKETKPSLPCRQN